MFYLFWGIITNAMHKNLPTSGTKMASNCDVHSPPCSFKYLTGQSSPSTDSEEDFQRFPIFIQLEALTAILADRYSHWTQL
jgi:hypothetical protein